MKARLDVIAGPEEGRSFELEEGRNIVVGRGAPCHCRIRDPRVSRAHFVLEKQPLAYRLFDLGSSGGTFVNGQRVRERDLDAGDVIRIGQSELRFVAGGLAASTSASLPAPEVLGAKTDESVMATVGKRLAGFEIQAPIGTGRLGFVFKACEPRKNVTVALKILRPEFSNDPEEMRRFVDTMKSARKLKHPNIVRVYTAGKTGGYCFVVTEYVEGESLARVIDRIATDGALDWCYAFRVGVHVARALQAARLEQVVHRNITPNKILISRDDGLARLRDSMLSTALEGTLAERVTQAPQQVGDALYMSPERVGGEAEVDGRSDIYSLGAVLYALLTGRPPLETSSLPALAAKIRDQQPERPRSGWPEIPERFEGIVMRMLAKRPQDRFQSPGDLLDELDRLGKDHGLSI